MGFSKTFTSFPLSSPFLQFYSLPPRPPSCFCPLIQLGGLGRAVSFPSEPGRSQIHFWCILIFGVFWGRKITRFVVQNTHKTLFTKVIAKQKDTTCLNVVLLGFNFCSEKLYSTGVWTWDPLFVLHLRQTPCVYYTGCSNPLQRPPCIKLSPFRRYLQWVLYLHCSL